MPVTPNRKDFEIVDRVYGALAEDATTAQLAERYRLGLAVHLLQEHGFRSRDGGKTWVQQR